MIIPPVDRKRGGREERRRTERKLYCDSMGGGGLAAQLKTHCPRGSAVQRQTRKRRMMYRDSARRKTSGEGCAVQGGGSDVIEVTAEEKPSTGHQKIKTDNG